MADPKTFPITVTHLDDPEVVAVLKDLRRLDNRGCLANLSALVVVGFFGFGFYKSLFQDSWIIAWVFIGIAFLLALLSLPSALLVRAKARKRVNPVLSRLGIDRMTFYAFAYAYATIDGPIDKTGLSRLNSFIDRFENFYQPWGRCLGSEIAATRLTVVKTDVSAHRELVRSALERMPKLRPDSAPSGDKPPADA